MDELFYVKVSGADQLRLQDAGVQFSTWRGTGISLNGKLTLEAAARALNADIERRRTVFGGLTEVRLKRRRVDTRLTRRTPARTEALQTARAQYIRACAQRLGDMRQTALMRADQLARELRQAENALVFAARHDCFSGELSQEAFAAAISSEMGQLRALDKVTDVRVISDSVVVYTDMLYAEDTESNAVYEVGRFAIWIRLSGDKPGVYWSNCTRRIDGAEAQMNAPYVYESGESTNEQIKVPMLELIGRLEVAAVADLAIQFVQTIEVDHPLNAFLSKWPRVRAVAGTQSPSRAKTFMQRALGRFFKAWR